MIQKTKKYYRKDLKGIMLFIEDLNEILNLFESYNLKISFQDEINTYENIEEIIEHKGNKPDNLFIEGKNENPYETVELRFNNNNNNISISTNGSERMYSLGIILKDKFSNSIKWHYNVFNPFIYYFSTSCILSSLFLKSVRSHFSVFIFIFTISLSLWLFSYLIRKNLYGIYLIKKHQYGFLKRNKDSLIIAVISAFLGAILGVLGTILLK